MVLPVPDYVRDVVPNVENIEKHLKNMSVWVFASFVCSKERFLENQSVDTDITAISYPLG